MTGKIKFHNIYYKIITSILQKHYKITFIENKLKLFEILISKNNQSVDVSLI